MMMMIVVAVEYYVYQLSPFGQVRFVWLGEKHQMGFYPKAGSVPV